MRRVIFTSLVIFGLVVGSALQAAAIPPIMVSFDDTSTDTFTHICPFPVSVTSSFSGTETDFFDPSGEVVKVIIQVVEQDSFSANGVTVTGDPFTFSVHLTIENGEVTAIRATGVAEKIRLPDGTFFISAGVIDFIAQGVDFSIVTDHGVTGDIDALCGALSP